MPKILPRTVVFRFGLVGLAATLALTIFLQSFVFPLPLAYAVNTIPVTTNADSGAGSLRDAITTANNNITVDIISFSIGSGSQKISLASPLPAITKIVTLDATTQPGYAGTPLIELDGSSAGVGANGLEVNSNDHTIIKGLVINNFSGSGVFVNGSATANTTIQNCCIGTDAVGNTAKPNGTGILISGAANTLAGTVGATSPSNIISGNTTYGIDVAGPNVVNTQVYSNYIGLDQTGKIGLGNATGIEINGAPLNVLGGSDGNYRNFIAANSGTGILVHGVGATANEARNNQVGLKSDNSNLKNGGPAIRVFSGGQLRLFNDNRVRA